MTATHRILVVRFSSMGDILLTTPLLRAIKERHPRAEITYITKAGFTPLLAHNPRIATLIGFDPATDLKALGERLAAETFTQRLDLHGSLRSLRLRRLVGGRWTSYAKHRLARGLLIRTKLNLYRDRRPVAERYFDAARSLDVTPDGRPLEFFFSRSSQEAADRFLRERALGEGRSLVAIAPGTAHKTKEWPVGHWESLVADLVSGGSDVVVLGGPAELALGERLAAAGGGHAGSAAGHFDIAGSAALLKRARSFASGDTGLMHLATAVGTPAVALFGPTVEPFGFFPYRAKATVLQIDLSCRPCSAIGGDRCPLGHHRCLVDITPATVLDALRRLPK